MQLIHGEVTGLVTIIVLYIVRLVILLHIVIKLILEYSLDFHISVFCIAFRIGCIVNLLNLDHMLINKVKHLLLSQSLLLRSLQPIRKPHPLVFSSLETTVLLKHLEPLLRSSLAHLDSLYCFRCVGNEDGLVAVGCLEQSFSVQIVCGIRFVCIFANRRVKRKSRKACCRFFRSQYEDLAALAFGLSF